MYQCVCTIALVCNYKLMVRLERVVDLVCWSFVYVCNGQLMCDCSCLCMIDSLCVTGSCV